MTTPPIPSVFQGKCVSSQPHQIPCVFSGKMRLAFNVTVNLYVAPANPSRFRIFFQGKRAWQQPFQIPCVFSSKTRRAFNVTVNLYVMRPRFLVFFHRKCAPQDSCHIPWVHFPCVFSSKMSLGFTSDCEFTCDAANRSRILSLFSRKTCVAETLPDSRCFFNENAACIQGD